MEEVRTKIVPSKVYTGKRNTFQAKEDKQRPILKVQRSSTQMALKSPKPSIEIYRPPKTSQPRPSPPSSNNHRVHFEAPSPTKAPAPNKYVLKRSKSFGGADMGFTNSLDLNNFTGTQQKLINKALIDPGSLELSHLLEVVKSLCSKAMETSGFSQPVAQLCCSIAEKDERKLFLECLANACREWFAERERLVGTSARRFTAYVLFVMELYLGLKPLQLGAAPGPSSSLLHLLYESCQLMASPRSLAEVECLKTVMLSAGRQMEAENSVAMARLIEAIRLGCVDRNASPQTRKVLLELTELRASHWSFSPRQAIYYYPYTNNKL